MTLTNNAGEGFVQDSNEMSNQGNHGGTGDSIAAISQENDGIASRGNATFHEDGYALKYTEEGVFLDFLQKQKSVTQDYASRLNLYLERKQVKDMDRRAFVEALSNPEAMSVKIAPPQQEFFYPAKLEVKVSDRDMVAHAILHPGESPSSMITCDEALETISTEYRIVHGIDVKALEMMIQMRIFDNPTVIARGTPPVTGENGSLKWHFNNSKEDRYKKIDFESKVNFKELDLFVPVTKGQLLVERIPAGEGTPGHDVYGNELKASPGKNVNLPKGKNVDYSEDRNFMYAAGNGMVDFVMDKVMVSNVYTVRGNADMGVGNITFDGDVVIEGNVIGGLTIKATGNIMVSGVVEASFLEAGGDILLRGGIQGSGRGQVRAGGMVTSKFIEYATIYAKNKIIAAYFIHSNAFTEGAIEVTSGKKGCIIGGNLSAGTYIAALTIGTPTNVPTVLEVGFSKAQAERIKEIKQELEINERKINQIKTVAHMNVSNESLSHEQQEMRNNLLKSLYQLSNVQKQLQTELDTLNDKLSYAEHGLIHVTQKIYSGVRLSIGSINCITSEEFDYVTFRVSDGEIKSTTCCFRP